MFPIVKRVEFSLRTQTFSKIQIFQKVFKNPKKHHFWQEAFLKWGRMGQDLTFMFYSCVDNRFGAQKLVYQVKQIPYLHFLYCLNFLKDLLQHMPQLIFLFHLMQLQWQKVKKSNIWTTAKKHFKNIAGSYFSSQIEARKLNPRIPTDLQSHTHQSISKVKEITSTGKRDDIYEICNKLVAPKSLSRVKWATPSNLPITWHSPFTLGEFFDVMAV